MRAAAKNYRDVIAVCDPSDYEMVMDGLRRPGGLSDDGRRLYLIADYPQLYVLGAYGTGVSSEVTRTSGPSRL